MVRALFNLTKTGQDMLTMDSLLLLLHRWVSSCYIRLWGYQITPCFLQIR
jgi:hypothetical protein